MAVVVVVVIVVVVMVVLLFVRDFKRFEELVSASVAMCGVAHEHQASACLPACLSACLPD